MLLFVDTEFADVHARELVSLALVSEDGRFEFYAERDPLPSSPTEFVRDVVYPLLSRGEHALPDDRFARELRAFFERVGGTASGGKIQVAYDFEADIHLLDYALDGFTSGDLPTPTLFEVFDLRVLGDEYAKRVEEMFETQPLVRTWRHYSLVDSWVNRDAYLAVRRATSERSAASVAADLRHLREGQASGPTR